MGRDLDILYGLDGDQWVSMGIWVLVVVVVWAIAANACNKSHQEWSKSEVSGAGEDLDDF